MLRFTKPFIVAALTAVLVAGLSNVGTASVSHASKAKFCKTAIRDNNALNVGGTGGEDLLEKAFKKLAKLAPTTKLKNAIKVIAAYNGAIARHSPRNVGPSDTAYIKALETFNAYLDKNCTA